MPPDRLPQTRETYGDHDGTQAELETSGAGEQRSASLVRNACLKTGRAGGRRRGCREARPSRPGGEFGRGIPGGRS